MASLSTCHLGLWLGWQILLNLLQDYNKALKYVKALLTIEPGNHQAQELKEYIDQKMKKGEFFLSLHGVLLLLTVAYLSSRKGGGQMGQA